MERPTKKKRNADFFLGQLCARVLPRAVSFHGRASTARWARCGFPCGPGSTLDLNEPPIVLGIDADVDHDAAIVAQIGRASGPEAAGEMSERCGRAKG